MGIDQARESVTLSELDLRIVQALQINPRASWSQVGRLLGVDPSTAARRWSRLVEHGAAWVSCQPLQDLDPALAVIEVVARPGRVLDVAAELAGDPQSMTIDVAAGTRDLLVTAACADEAALASYLLDRVAQVPQVAGVRSHIVVRAYTEASRWRLRTLTPEQEQAIAATVPTVAESSRVHVRGPIDQALVGVLSEDGRQTHGEVAARVGASESTVRRRIHALIGSGVLRLRCEVARGLTEWRTSEWFFLRVPSDRIDEAGQLLAAVPEVRAVLSAAGPYNLLVAVWLRSVADGQRLEIQLTRRLPHVEVADRSVVIRPYKLVGRLLDERGFATGVVPLDLGTAPTSRRARSE
ncbi:Lrp/AsnC family transcriptional regulator [Nocardioides albidus]|uniref:Lrp/AsnC family transcriptional regulator n=1 Tax=Nocardioides albidus TaxID=1517589 RepID=A0A5C4VNC0_9ACTN|nr:Lrp/AsnC family transcriptional regulator [Nocardioides albidus]TNM37400.1 Lrp/AsnC family transcriptional regulator [Nocardioides albidus]